MKSLLLVTSILFLCFFSRTHSSQGQACIISHPPNPTALALYESKNGWYLPASDTIRILCVLAEINYDTLTDPNGATCWPAGNLPGWENSLLDVNTPGSGQLTNYFNQASSGNYIVLGDYLLSSFNNGIFIVNKSDLILLGNFPALESAINSQMINGFRTLSGITDPNQFDKWTPSGLGMAKTKSINNSFDHVMVLWRNSGIPNGTGNGNYGSICTILGRPSDSWTQFGAQCGMPLGIARHEYSHLFLGHNNFHVSGGAEENMWIQKISAHSLLSLYDAALGCWSAWDRHRLDWKAPGNTNRIAARNPANTAEVSGGLDATNSSHAGTYTLRDFVTTGDALRIKLPFIPSNKFQEYIWLENHNGKTLNGNIHDEYIYANGNPCITPAPYGLYAYMQVGKDIISDSSSSILFDSPSDYIRYISAYGFYDQTLQNFHVGDSSCWPVYARPFVLNQANPLTGIGDNDFLTFDTIANPPNTITYGDGYPHNVELINGVYNYNLYQGGNSRQVFSLSGVKRFGLGTNPSTASMMNLSSFNLPGNEPKDNNSVYLNGVSIEIVNQSGGNIQVQIKFDDVDVDNDTRFCGPDIVLSPINSPSGYSLNLKTGRKLTVDQGYTATRMDTPIVISGINYYTDTTIMRCLANSSINLESGSELIVDNNSILVFEPNSQIDIRSGAILRVKNGGILKLENNAMINVMDGGQVIIEDDGFFDYYENAQLILTGQNAVCEINGILNIQDNATFTFTSNSTQHGYLLFSNTSLSPSRNITAGINASINLQGSSNNKPVLQIDQETFYAPVGLVSLNISDGKVVFNSGSRLQADDLNTNIDFTNVRFTSNSGAYNGHRGVHLYGQQNVNISGCTFEYGQTGIFGFLTYGGSPLNIYNSTFRHNYIGLDIRDKGINLFQCNFFNNNDYGVYGRWMSFPSLSFEGITGGGYSYGNSTGYRWAGAGTASFLLDNPFINYNVLGVRADNVPLQIRCGSISYNETGIAFNHGATLHMDDQVNTPHSADVSVYQNDFSIQTWYGRYIYLNKGNNNLEPVSVQSQTCINGTLTDNPNLPIPGANNWWGTSSLSGNDYNLTHAATNAPYIINGVELAYPSITCGQATPPCPNPPCEQESPLDYCPLCETITTEDFDNIPLNEAAGIAIDQLAQTSDSNYLEAIDLFVQILQVDFQNITDEEKYVLDYCYLKMMEALGHAYRIGQLTCAEWNDLSTSIIAIQNNLILAAASNSDEHSLYKYSLDKAQTYRIGCERDSCIMILEDMLTWLTESDYISSVENFMCQVSIEIQVMNEELALEDIYNALEYCGNYNLRMVQPGRFNAESKEIISEITYEISPNPVIDQTEIRTNIETGEILVFDMLGNLVLRERLNYEATLNCLSLLPGVYSITLSDSKRMLTENARIVIQ